MTMSFVQYLENTIAPDANLRSAAAQYLENVEKQDFQSYIGLLAQELSNNQNSLAVRQTAGLLIKNSLVAKEVSLKEMYAKRWLTIAIEFRSQIKNAIVLCLNANDVKAGTVAAQVVAAIADIELPRNEWPELMPGLLQNVGMDSVIVKQTSLQAIGFICEIIDPLVLTTQANQILTAVAQGARKEETSDDVRLAAIQALYNSLEFVRENFENEGERNYIMQIVCEATQSQNIDVQVAAYECLVRIVTVYYDKMEMYMRKALFGLTMTGMKHQSERVALQAIEFWSSVCEEEIDLHLLAAEAAEIGQQPERLSLEFSLNALGDLVPILLFLLTKQEEDTDDDEWTVAMAAATCLGLLANTVEDAIVPPVLAFVEQHIKSGDWKYREASVMAFGSILEGPNPQMLLPLVNSAFMFLIEMMNDPSEHVKDTTAWCLGKVCEVLPDCVFQDALLPRLMEALVVGLKEDSSRVASNSCWALINLSEQVGEDELDTYQLSPYFSSVIDNLMLVANKSDMNSNFRASAYEAISSFVTSCARDCFPTVEKLTMIVLDRLNETINQQVVNMDDKRQLLELQANLCSVLTAIIRKMTTKIMPLSDRIMQSLILVMNNASKSSTVLEDAFLTVGALTTAVEGDFLRYMDSFMPILFNALANVEEHALCSIAVGIVGDISRALNEQILPFCDAIMNCLVSTLQNELLHRNVKPVILSSFGDIALACGGKFEGYLNFSMGILQQAQQTSITDLASNDYALVEYANFLREGIVEAYVGIVQGIKTGNNALVLTPYVATMFSFIESVATDTERTEATYRGALGLLGDLAETFPPGQLNSFYRANWIDSFIKGTRGDRLSTSTKEVAKWAREMIKKQL